MTKAQQHQAALKKIRDFKLSEYFDPDNIDTMREIAGIINPLLLIKLLEIAHCNGMKQAAAEIEDGIAGVNYRANAITALQIDGYNEPGDVQPEKEGQP